MLIAYLFCKFVSTRSPFFCFHAAISSEKINACSVLSVENSACYKNTRRALCLTKAKLQPSLGALAIPNKKDQTLVFLIHQRYGT